MADRAMMRIVHFNEHLGWVGGVETYLLHLVPALEAAGVVQHYVYAHGDPGLLPQAHSLPEIVAFGRSAEAAGYARTAKLLAELRPDVIHLHRVYNLGVLGACLDYGATVVTCHDYLYLCPAGSFFHRRTQTICHRRAGLGCFAVTLLRHCMTPRPRYALGYYRRVRKFAAWRDRFAAVLCPSNSVRERLWEQGFPPHRAHVLPYFCPIRPRTTPRPLPGKPTVLFFGRIRPIKGYDVFLQALGMLPGVRALMVGDVTDGMADRLGRLADRCGCGDRLEVRPWIRRDEVASLFDEASVFAFPSICPETLGIVGLEALACGVPVVASDVGGVREWLHDGKTGFLVPPKDAHKLADALARVLNSADGGTALGRNGIALIRERFLPESHLERLLAIYRQAANGKLSKDSEIKAKLLASETETIQ